MGCILFPPSQAREREKANLLLLDGIKGIIKLKLNSTSSFSLGCFYRGGSENIMR